MRIAGQGLVKHDRKIDFTFDGATFQGLAGDTLASALLANGVKLVGRSFKYHRPRGILTAGSEEPNALMTLKTERGSEPNIRATVQELYDGLTAQSQNRWPSLACDVMAMNDLAAPFLGAGFYYKTFMWPRGFWEKLYEPVIRKAAGLGVLDQEHNRDRYEKAFAFCDLLVIGAGPTGLIAALMAARAGADVIIADDDHRPGGRLLSETYEIDGKPAHVWADTVIAELSDMENVRIMSRTTVTGAYDQGTFGALERVGHHLAKRPDALPVETFWRIVAKRTILATGAIERPVAFRNNDRPGIMMAGAVRAYLNRWGVAPGKRVAVFSNNDTAHRTVHDLQRAGVNVVALIDSRHDAPEVKGVRTYRGAMVSDTGGRRELNSITVRGISGEDKLAVDCLAMSGGWNPTLHLTCHMNARPVWRDDLQSFVPVSGAVPGMQAAGACNGAFHMADCLQEGIEAATAAISDLGLKRPTVSMSETEDDAYRLAELWAVPGRGRAWLDFQNDVTVKDVKQAAIENFRSVEHMKRYTTQGMATDQGKNSNVAALAILADATGRTIPDTGTTTFRPPFSPVSIAAMGAGGQGKGFAPERLTTSHSASAEIKAPMIEAGLWYRPGYFPQAGETTWRQSCDREVKMVRNAVGVCDVTTLGKIDIQGPDAGALLDFVYCNSFSTLKVGRVRYGLMLREDGHVMDDGTTARLGETHFLMTTTTAAAGQVMRHLEFVHQCLRPDLDVVFTSVTEQWAQFAVAGPKSKDLLNTVLDAPLNSEKWPFMACGPVQVRGLAGRLFRISFSGEHAYEIAVPARYGDSLFRLLLDKAKTFGGGPYGMEALNVLRIEKGFITHAEIHGRTTADDIGMGRMVSQKKDCIGKVMSEREGLSGPEREQLVGLRPTGEIKALNAGAHIFDPDEDPVRVNDKGYVTSVAYSPTLDSMLALGFLKNGRARHGQTVRVVDHLRDLETICEIVDPVFFDPEGERVRG